MTAGLAFYAACSPGSKTDTCETNPQPGCPNYVEPDPCETNPQPGCPNYVEPDPCETNPQPGCPYYVDPCVANPQPGCPNYDPVPVPVLAPTITLGTANYTVSSTYTEKFADGFWYIRVTLNNSTKPLIIHAVRYKAGTPGYSIEAWSGKDSINGKETPSAMVKRYETAGREVKVAINGGFYGMSTDGVPSGPEIVKGMMTYLGDVSQPIIGFDSNNRPHMDFLKFNAKVKNKNGVESAITTVNGITRNTNNMVLYNSAKGKRTGTNEWGAEVLCTPETGQWEILDSYLNVSCQIDRIEPVSGKGNMAIPKGKIVLSGHGTANTYLTDKLSAGDDVEVTVNYTLKTDSKVDASVIRNAVAGYNIILQGNNIIEPNLNVYDDPTLITNSHPRTSVGFSADKEYVFFTVVEGRRAGVSAGVTTRELAQVMKYLGAANAINLDGGGSSCLIVDKTRKNVMSDGSERAVCNGLAIIKK
ncbi:MAG: phosphodiester glycosidase family protein [Prevotellaceae bacterium]|nr:phosphodiester glycosidase family protein [Prevotellaceae bacterium]